MVLVFMPCDHVTLINVAQLYAVKGSPEAVHKPHCGLNNTTMLTVEIWRVNKTFCYPTNIALLKKHQLPTPASHLI